MHHPTDRINHTTAFVTPVVEHWLEREIAQWVSLNGDASSLGTIHKWPTSTVHLPGELTMAATKRPNDKMCRVADSRVYLSRYDRTLPSFMLFRLTRVNLPFCLGGFTAAIPPWIGPTRPKCRALYSGLAAASNLISSAASLTGLYMTHSSDYLSNTSKTRVMQWEIQLLLSFHVDGV